MFDSVWCFFNQKKTSYVCSTRLFIVTSILLIKESVPFKQYSPFSLGVVCKPYYINIFNSLMFFFLSLIFLLQIIIKKPHRHMISLILTFVLQYCITSLLDSQTVRSVFLPLEYMICQLYYNHSETRVVLTEWVSCPLKHQHQKTLTRLVS